jgi:hypothetical protein
MRRISTSALERWQRVQTSAGRILLGAATIAFGLQQWLTRGWIGGLRIQPAWEPLHALTAFILGAMLIVGGACLLRENPWGRLAACSLGILFLVSDVLVRGSQYELALHDVGVRTGVFEALALAAGYFLVAQTMPAYGARAQRWRHSVWTTAEMSRILFAVCLWVFGADHIQVAPLVASLIPAWIPGHLFWTYATAAGLIATAFSTLVRRLATLSSCLLGWMFFLWVVLLHAPRVAAHWSNTNEWNSALVAVAMAGCSWVLAASASLAAASVRMVPVQARRQEPGARLKHSTLFACILCAGMAAWAWVGRAANLPEDGSNPAQSAAAPSAMHGPVPVFVELFTSEGCSSCPPADEFLQRLDEKQPLPGTQLIVLSEHVDYFNHEGWKDPYSSSSMTSRQYEYVHAFGLKDGYTPQMIVDGSWELHLDNPQQEIQVLKKAADAKMISVEIGPVQASTAAANTLQTHVAVRGSGLHGKANVYAAIALDHAQSHVLHGENQGKDLQHVAVLVQLLKIGSLNTDGVFDQDLQIKLKPAWKGKELRILVFVQRPNAGSVVGAAMRKTDA